MRLLIWALAIFACGCGPEWEAERALSRAAPGAFRAYEAARDARDSILERGGPGLQQGIEARERARITLDRAGKVGRREVAAAQEWMIEIHRRTNTDTMRTYMAAADALWQAERRLCRLAPGAWRLYVEVMDLDGTAGC